ncbi:AraC family transcriptional regulator [Haloechinothrix sp. LS1_15]|nr:AraC family transcriptional regulator [Haloechinothrix sp. LS1_15]
MGYRQHGRLPELHRGLPSCYATLVISLAEPIRVRGTPDGTRTDLSLSAAVGGLYPGPVMIAPGQYQHGVQIELHPLGLRQLLGHPAAALSGQVADLGDLARPELASLPERLATARTWTDRFAVLDSALLSATRGEVAVPAEVTWAWHEIVRRDGGLAVTELAAAVGWSKRHLSGRFRCELGVSPKQVARIARFERARRLLGQDARQALATVAVECGYYDQAHMSNEWRTLAGCSPSRWLAEELPFLQANGDDSQARYGG